MAWIVGIIILLIIGVLFVSKEGEAEASRAAQLKIEKETKEEHRAALEGALADWILGRQSEGWTYLSRGKLMHIPGQPECIMALSEGRRSLRFDEFAIQEDLKFAEPIYLGLSQVVSLNVARPKVTKRRKETVPVGLVESKNKSPVARGIIGGALLGPAGVVIGAASGLNAKTSTTVHHETVYRQYETEGAPQLIIGTNSAENPVFKIQCANQEVADGWMFRIRGLQS